MKRRSYQKVLACLVIAVGSVLSTPPGLAQSQAKEQFFPIFTFKVGPTGTIGTIVNAGYLDYFNLINIRDGGINGIKITYEECEMERKFDKGMECYEKLKNKGPTGASMFNPIGSDIAYALIKRTLTDKIPIVTGGYGITATSDGRVFPYMFPIGTNYWSMSTAKIKYIGLRLGGMNRLRGKNIVNLHHDSVFGRETQEILEIQANKYGFTVTHIAIPNPGMDQEALWKQITDLKPDWVILRGVGPMVPVALKTARKYGYPVSRILGVNWAGGEADVIPAGDAARGFITAAQALQGRDQPIIKDILKYVYGSGKGQLQDTTGIGSTYYNAGISGAIIAVEVIRTAQQRYGNRPLTGEEVRWGIENLYITDRRISEINGFGLMQRLKLSCADHEGGGSVRFQRWNGREWQAITGWIQGDDTIVRPLVERSAMAYAKKEGITPRDCEKEEPGAIRRQ